MRYNYKGFWGCEAFCDIEVHRCSYGGAGLCACSAALKN